ncbi:E3 ubiquitin-protein ligase Topors-like [Scleropages formosus]|uniref:E3 ubiquitin-protein ligase Topors-like n=1 Tax=Scleropages formosus TaxID=113540 RepID=UPI00087880DC|nr:E3 ubiquitin-protein ligase Topors-like [Scleropages formosus]
MAVTNAVMAAEESPDSKCPICLDCINDIADLDCCPHTFCFPCIQKWTDIQGKCPLCRRLINWIFHSQGEHVFVVFVDPMEDDDSSTPLVWWMSEDDDAGSLLLWDDDTPSPSPLAMTDNGVPPLCDIESELDHGEGISTEEEDCFTEGFVEPTAEWMPEDTELSSDCKEQHVQAPSLTGVRWRRSSRRSRSSSRSRSLSPFHSDVWESHRRPTHRLTSLDRSSRSR